MIRFVFGLIVGGALGVVLMALMNVAKDDR